MSTPQRYDWPTIRAEYEAGASMGELNRRYGVNKSAISRRARSEGWVQNLTGTVRRLGEARANGVNTVDPKKTAVAVAAAADRVADVIRRHRAFWPEVEAAIRAAIAEQDFDALKRAKISAEAYGIVQDRERRAWGLDAIDTTPTAAAASATATAVNIDFSGMSAAQINEIGIALSRGQA